MNIIDRQEAARRLAALVKECERITIRRDPFTSDKDALTVERWAIAHDAFMSGDSHFEGGNNNSFRIIK